MRRMCTRHRRAQCFFSWQTQRRCVQRRLKRRARVASPRSPRFDHAVAHVPHLTALLKRIDVSDTFFCSGAFEGSFVCGPGLHGPSDTRRRSRPAGAHAGILVVISDGGWNVPFDVFIFFHSFVLSPLRAVRPSSETERARRARWCVTLHYFCLSRHVPCAHVYPCFLHTPLRAGFSLAGSASSVSTEWRRRSFVRLLLHHFHSRPAGPRIVGAPIPPLIPLLLPRSAASDALGAADAVVVEVDPLVAQPSDV